MKSTVLLRKLCQDCSSNSPYIVRFYKDKIDLDGSFDMLPAYMGTCIVQVTGTDAHVNALSMPGGVFTREQYMDLVVQIRAHMPYILSISWEQHKNGSLVIHRLMF